MSTKIKEERVLKEVFEDGNLYIFECPHCEQLTEVEKSQVNCAIFRHAVNKQNMTQLPPHSVKEECERVVREGLVYGCAKPFRFVRTPQKNYVEICDYI